MNMKKIDSYEWGEVRADERDPDAGGASHHYEVRSNEAGPNNGECIFAEAHFQHGPRSVGISVRGALDDHILAIVQDRMDGFQAGPFACAANAEALEHIKTARRVLRERAEERRERGVLGKNEA